MKLIIDLEKIEKGKQNWLLTTLDFAQINFFTETETEWTETEIEEHNQLIDAALQDESISMEEAKKVMRQW